MLVLIIFPGFKGAFSNVIGYYVVYRASNTILVKLLGNTQVDRTLEDVPGSDADKANLLEKASDAVLKLVGNTSIMINQITPENFEDMWNMMTPIMKPEMRGGGAPLKAELLEQVILRDNIGECCYYLYTFLLLIVIVKTMLMKQECVTTVSDLKEKVNLIKKKERKLNKIKKIALLSTKDK